MATAECINFTAARLRRLTPGDKVQTYKDKSLKGLQLVICPGSTKTFEVYRKPKGSNKPVRVKIGNLADTTLKQAIAKADEINALLKQGIDPNELARQQAQKDAVENMTLMQGFNRYIEAKQLAPGTRDHYTRAISRDMEDWQHKPLLEITREMVLARFTEIEADYGKVPAQRMAQVLRAVWNFGNDMADDGSMPYGLCPTLILNKQKKGWARTASRSRRIRIEELPAWFKAA